MRGATLAVLFTATRLATAQSPPPITVAVDLVRERCFVGEPIEVTWRVRLDAAWLAEHALQPFQQPLDLPLQLLAPALVEWPGTIGRTPSWSDARGSAPADERTFALGEQRVAARVERSSGQLELTLRREFLAEAPGTLEFPPAEMIVAWTSGFEEDLLGGRVPRDRHETRIRSPARTIAVEPPPAAGRPPTYTGAVGAVELAAELSTNAVRLGETVTLTATFGGATNFEQFEPPPYAPAGFHVRGRAVARERERLVVRFELLPLSCAVDAVPSLAIDWLEPGPPPTWRRRESGNLRLQVTPRADGATELVDPGGAAAIEPALLELLAPLKALEGQRSSATATWFERGLLARRATRDGDFAAAARWWRAALEENGAPTAVLRFNLGHAEFARGRVVEALVEWLRAAPALRGDRDLRANVLLTARRLELDAFASAALAAWCDTAEERDRAAVVVADGVRLREAPGQDGGSDERAGDPPVLPRGTLHRIAAASSRYVELVNSRGATVGWVERSQVVLIGPSPR